MEFVCHSRSVYTRILRARHTEPSQLLGAFNRVMTNESCHTVHQHTYTLHSYGCDAQMYAALLDACEWVMVHTDRAHKYRITSCATHRAILIAGSPWWGCRIEIILKNSRQNNMVVDNYSLMRSTGHAARGRARRWCCGSAWQYCIAPEVCVSFCRNDIFFCL